MANLKGVLLVAVLVACGAPREGTTAANDTAPVGPPGAAPSLRRGMNLGNALDAPNEGDWGIVLDRADFEAIKAAGFDHVRLPARFNTHAGSKPPYAIDADFMARIDWAIDQALSLGLTIVIDFHHYEEAMTDPDGEASRFAGMWRQIAKHVRNRPPAVYLELLNEPHDALTVPKWNAMLAAALAAVRETNPTRKVIVEGVFWASAKNLRDTLQIPDDPNLIGSFHMYQPILFTHQGAAWMPPEYGTRGVVFPGPPQVRVEPVAATASVGWVREWFMRFNGESASTNPSGVATIASELDIAKGFADAHHLEIYMGEFGVMDTADEQSRRAWTRLVRVEAERRGFGWAYWDDGGSFAIMDRKTHAWRTDLKAALLE